MIKNIDPTKVMYETLLSGPPTRQPSFVIKTSKFAINPILTKQSKSFILDGPPPQYKK